MASWMLLCGQQRSRTLLYGWLLRMDERAGEGRGWPIEHGKHYVSAHYASMHDGQAKRAQHAHLH